MSEALVADVPEVAALLTSQNDGATVAAASFLYNCMTDKFGTPTRETSKWASVESDS